MRIALGTPLSYKDLIKHGEAFSKEKNAEFFTHITTDSREAQSGDLFFSLTSEKESADAHILEAQKKGAFGVSAISKHAFFLVKDSEKTLLRLAAFHKSELHALKATVAITGSVGKTTAKEFCASLLSSKYKVHETYMNYNNALGLSLSLLASAKDTEILVLELGMNKLGEIKELSEAIKPDYAVITNIGNAHIGMLGSREMIAHAKLEVSAGMKEELIIAPYEEPLLSKAKFKFSLFEKNCDFHLSLRKEGEAFEFYHSSDKVIEFKTNYKASHHLSALLIALSLAKILNLNETEMLRGIKNCENIVFRQRLIRLKDFSILDDTYSSSPEAVKAEIEYIKLEFPNRSFSLALGDMLELGNKTERLHKEIGRLAFLEGADKLYAFGAYAYLIRDGAKAAGMKDSDLFATTELLDYQLIAKEIYRKSKNGEIVLIKASHALYGGKITEEIERLDKEC